MDSSLPSVNTTLLALECMATYKTYGFSGSYEKILEHSTTPGTKNSSNSGQQVGPIAFCLTELHPSVSCDVNHKLMMVN